MNSGTRPLWKKLVSAGLLLSGLIFVTHSTFSLYTLAKRGDRVGEEKLRLKELEKEQEVLKKQLSDTYTTFFIEEEARNKLGLVKPGETIVYLEKNASEAAKRESQSQKVTESRKTVLQQWWEVFF